MLENKLSQFNNNLKVYETKRGVVFTQFRVYCPHCCSKYVVEDGYYHKKLVLYNYGNIDARIKRYECRNGGKGFSADSSCVVDTNLCFKTYYEDNKGLLCYLWYSCA